MNKQFNQQLFDEAHNALEAAERFAGYLIDKDINTDESYLEMLQLFKIADTKIRECIATNGGKIYRLQEFPLPGGGVVEYAIKF